jgi:WD40 repeat protein
MLQVGPANIFISYARKDGADLARRLQADLKKEGFDAWLDTQRLIGGAAWNTEIEQALDACHVTLALLTPGSYLSEICRAEQLRALRKGKRVIPLLAQPGSDIPLHLEAKHYRDFTGARPYNPQFKLLLEDIRLGRTAITLQLRFRTTYVTAPPLPRNYVERPEALANLRQALMTDGSGPTIALTALKGMGGIGKTILAQALCHDEVMQQAFPDGVIWVTAGKESAHDLRTRMREVAKALGDDLTAYDNELGCVNRYRTMMRERAALIVVDDVWWPTDVEPFRAESPRSRLLFTTRDASIAAAVGAEEHVAGLLTGGQAKDLLAKCCVKNLAELPAEAETILLECGGLPLAVAMIGAMLRGRPAANWKHVGYLLRRADLAKIKAQFPNYPHTDLLRAIQVSVEALDPKARDRYLALAVLLEDMPIHPVVQQTLWGVGEQEVLETAERFVDLSLAQRVVVEEEANRRGEGGGIRLHDLQLDYIRAQYPDREALDLIHGAVRLSSHVIERDPRQFASQMVGRLLPNINSGEPLLCVQEFTSGLIAGAPRPWLRPLQPSLSAPGTALVRTLAGHFSGVSDVAVTRDGRRAVSASRDRTLRVWNLETGREVRMLAGHTAEVWSVALTPDGRRAVSTSADHTLKLWDLETGQILRTFEGHLQFRDTKSARMLLAVTDVAVLPNEEKAISASQDKTLKVWDLESGRALLTLEGHSDGIRRLAVTPDGTRVVSASDDRTLKVWDLRTGHYTATLVGHSDRVSGVAVTADGKRTVSASFDRTLKVWDLESGRALLTLEGHGDAVMDVAVTPDGNRAVSASADRMLKVWDLVKGVETSTLAGHSDAVISLDLTADGSRVISASSDETLKVWDLTKLERGSSHASHAGSVTYVAITPDGRRVVSAADDHTLKVWDASRGRAELTLQGESDSVVALAVSADGQRALAAYRDAMLKEWDLETGRELRTLVGHLGKINRLALSADWRQAACVYCGTLTVWKLNTGVELRIVEGHAGFFDAVAVTPDGGRAVFAFDRSSLKVWDLESGRELHTLAGHSQVLRDVVVSEDGRLAVSASEDGRLKVWDLETGHEVQTLRAHSQTVWAVALSRDGRTVVSASEDKTLKVWELKTGTLLASFNCDAEVRCCAFLDRHRIVAGDASGWVHFLSLEPPDSPGGRHEK